MFNCVPDDGGAVARAVRRKLTHAETHGLYDDDVKCVFCFARGGGTGAESVKWFSFKLTQRALENRHAAQFISLKNLLPKRRNRAEGLGRSKQNRDAFVEI